MIHRNKFIQVLWSHPTVGDTVDWKGDHFQIIKVDPLDQFFIQLHGLDCDFEVPLRECYWVPSDVQIEKLFVFFGIYNFGVNHKGFFCKLPSGKPFLTTKDTYLDALVEILNKYNGLDVTITKQFANISYPAILRSERNIV